MRTFEDFAFFVYDTFKHSSVLKDGSVRRKIYDDDWNVLNVSNVGGLKLENSSYMDSSIASTIRKIMTTVHKKECHHHGVNIQYEFWDTKVNMKSARFFLGYACFLIELLGKINKKSTSLKLILINYNGKKQIPSNDTFTSYNVNSGVTIYYSESHGEIIVYRNEEMVKVLTHEMVHFYNIDSKFHNRDLEDNLNKLFCLQNGSTLNVNEAFTECFACMVNIVMYTILENGGRLTIAKLHKNQEIEQIFMRGQAFKVLSTIHHNNACTRTNHEQTHAISYFVIKAILLQDMDKYVQFLYNGALRLKDMEHFVKLIETTVSDVNRGSFGQEDYERQKDKKTMRMTILDTVELMRKRKGYKGNIHP